MRIMGLDIGDARIGVALSDPSGFLATPHSVIHRKSNIITLQKIQDVISSEAVEMIVAGLPLTLKDEIGPQATKILEYIAYLQNYITIPIETWDERYSSLDAEERMRELGVKPQKRREMLDAVAASVFLQDYLDAHYKTQLHSEEKDLDF